MLSHWYRNGPVVSSRGRDRDLEPVKKKKKKKATLSISPKRLTNPAGQCSLRKILLV